MKQDLGMFVPNKLYGYAFMHMYKNGKEVYVCVCVQLLQQFSPVALLQWYPSPLIQRAGKILQTLKTWSLYQAI